MAESVMPLTFRADLLRRQVKKMLDQQRNVLAGDRAEGATRY